MLLVGLTGTMGSGKSTVREMFEKVEGGTVYTIDCDALAKEILASPEFRGTATAILGADCFPDGSLDRGKVAEKIFRDPEMRERLESKLHPMVILAVSKRVVRAAHAGNKVAMVESAILLNNRLRYLCHLTICVTCHEQERRRRLRENRGFTDEQITERLANQMPEETMAALSDYAIGSDCALDELERRVTDMHQTLMTIHDVIRGERKRPELDARSVAHYKYDEPWRHYHTWNHVDAALVELGRAWRLANNLPALEWAIRFHDAVYEPTAHNNEERSAELAEHLLVGRIPDEMVCEVSRLIRLTKEHRPAPNDIDGQIICDCDLAMIGKPWEQFEAAGQAIRKEFAHVSDDDFRFGRAAFLRSMLTRPRIYNLPPFFDKYEQRARENLRRALAELNR